MAARGRGLIFLYIYKENFKIKIFVRNHWTDFIITWQKCFLFDPLPRLLSSFIKKPGRQGAGLFFLVYLYRKVLKIFLSETNGPISVSLGRNVSLVTLYQDCSSRYDLSKNMAARGRGIFSLYIYIENFKNLLLRNCWIKFNVTWQECCFDDLLLRLFTP